MKINTSNVTFSSIVGIGQKVKKASQETKEEYIELNRGVNSVVGIDLTEIKPMLDFNSKELQVYAPNTGLYNLKKAINKEYFPSSKNIDNNISITPGGMPALDLVFQILNVSNIYFPKFYWGSYSKMATIRQKSFSFYNALDDVVGLNENSCVVICDPNNPTGIKLYDDYLYNKIKSITSTGAVVIFDAPYRKLFYDDYFFDKISETNNVIITESFSKWIGLSGIRLGFIYSNNKDFNSELNIRLLYEFNGVSSISQMIVEKIISTKEGKKAHGEFRHITRLNIKKNIEYLKKNSLLVDEIYNDLTPMGIFAIINKSEDFLFKNKIGAVGLDKFIHHNRDMWSSYSRICVSIPHDKFVKFFNKII